MTEIAANVLEIICATLLISGAILFCTYIIISQIATDEKRNDYINSLDEHDKSVIATYKAIYKNPFKKEKKK